MRLRDKVALITGASSGIGLACVRRFAAEGAVVAGLDKAPCKEWQDAVSAAAGQSFHQLDVTDAAAQEQAVAAVKAVHGRVDVLVTAAGVAGGAPAHLLEVREWDRVMDINLKGTFLSVRAVLPTMLEQGSGSIITIASVEGLEGAEGGTPYNVSKGGVVLLTRCIAMDYARRGIRCNALCPGFIDTPLLRSVMDMEGFEEYREAIREQHKMGRFGEAREIASVALFFAGDDASFVTGQALAVDGGYTTGHSYGLVKMMGLD